MSSAARLNRLVDLARDGSPDARRALAAALTEIFIARPQRLNAAELRHFDAIMSCIIDQGDAALRRQIAEKFASLAQAPKELITRLAHDQHDVAAPLLTRSPAISDADLIAIVEQCGDAHRKAIAKRRVLSESLTEALVKHAGDDALTALAENQGARFSAAAMQGLTQKARRAPALQAPITGRFDLPPPFLTQLYFFVPAPLKKQLLARADMLDPSLIDAAETANRRKLYAQAQSGAELSEARAFIAEKIAANAVNESLLKELLSEPRQTEFIYAFAYIVGVDMASAKAIVNDGNFESLALACRAGGLEHETFTKIVSALRKDEDQSKPLRILDLYLKISQASAERMMRFWRMRTGAAETAGLLELEPLELRDRAKGW